MSAKINRQNIDRALKRTTKVFLAEYLGISRPTLDKIIDGHNPHESMCEMVNSRTIKFLEKSTA